ncbi:MAG: ABC transporter permease [Ignavibacteriales bacterium]|nr:ABC transporter permease [Ignavibacteriales bacterium]
MKSLVVARWEFMEKVKSKAFIISLVLMPLIMVGFGVLPGLLASKPDAKPITVGMIDETGSILKPLSAKLDEKYKLPDGRPNYILRNLKEDGSGDDLKSRAVRMISNKEMEGYFSIPSTVYDSGRVEYRAENVGNIRISERFSRTMEEVIVEQRLTGRGLNPAEIKKLMANIDVKALKVSERGGEKESGFLQTFASAYIVIMMLMFLVMTSGQLLIRSVVEEKSNRVIEVLLSSCSARDLMIGKILGLSGLGILQMLIWGVIGLGIALKSGANIFEMEPVLVAILYVFVGYFFYSAIFVAAGSPVTTEQEAQQITSYVSLVLVFPIVLMVPAMQNPDSSLIKILSYIPLLTPAFMVLRVSIQMPPLWEILATLGLLLASTVLMMWVAGKIFRTAILVYGKRPTIPELIRWIRTP